MWAAFFVVGPRLMPELSTRSEGMNTPLQFNSNHLQSALSEKLQPSRFPRMSSVMAGIVGFIVQAQFTDPEIAEIVVTSDGFVLARADGEVSANHFIGRYPDLLRNWLRLIAAAELTTRELIEAQAAFAAKIGFLGREIA